MKTREIRDLPIPPKVGERPLAEQERRPAARRGDWVFQSAGQEFDFRQGLIFLNRENLAKHLSDNLTHFGVHYWTALARRLSLYRDWATLNVEDPEALGQFLAIVHALLTKIYGRIKKKFDETLDGVSFHLEEGQLLINGINVTACLKMFQRRPTPKGRIFLKGLRGRMAVLQSNRSGSANYEKIRESVNRLALAIDEELRKHPVVIELPPPNSSLPPAT